MIAKVAEHKPITKDLIDKTTHKLRRVLLSTIKDFADTDLSAKGIICLGINCSVTIKLWDESDEKGR